MQDVSGVALGCFTGLAGASCADTSVLTDDDFTYGGVDYQLREIGYRYGQPDLIFVLDKSWSTQLKSAGTIAVDGTTLHLADLRFKANNNGLADALLLVPLSSIGGGWSAGDTVELSLTVSPTVSISASPTTVDEGGSVTITVTLSEALSSRVIIPLVVYGFSAEPGDYSALSGISIRAGETSGTGTITARHDTDTHDEVFGVDLGTLPAEVVRGDPWSVSITIIDDDLPFGVTTVPGSGTGLKILPTNSNVQPVPASRRAPTGAGAGGAFCYTTVGNGTTEYIRYPDGRLVETTKQSQYIMSLYACE